jgi:exonuclease III
MSSVIIGSVNCRGLAEKIKRGDILSICKERYDITVLTDTHCCLENKSHWLGEWGYIGIFSSYSSRSRGVAVLFKNSFEFKINSEILDTDGNFVILDITIQDYRLTLVTIYGPSNPDFFQSLQSKICLYENTSVIVVGDWNVVQNYDKDTFNYQSENNPRAQIKVHQMLNDLDLVDIRRVQHPSQKKIFMGGV